MPKEIKIIAGTDMGRLRKQGFIFLFIIFVFLSLFPRAVEVLNGNYVFGFDQGRDYLAVKNIVIHHKLTLIGPEIGAGSAGFQYIFHGPGYYYLLSLPFILFGGDPYGGIVLMLILGLASIGVGYFLGKAVFGPVGGWITALMIAVSPPLISQARFVWNSHPTTLFILLAFASFYRFLKSHKPKFLFFAAFLSGFLYNFELAIAVPMSTALLGYSIYLFGRSKWKNYGIVFLGFLLAYAPALLFEMKHNFLALHTLLTPHESKTQITLYLLRNFSIEHINVLLYNLVDTFPFKPYVAALPLLIVGILLFCVCYRHDNDQIRKKFFLYLAIQPIVAYVVFFFLIGNVYIYYFIQLNIVYILVFSYIVASLLRFRSSVPQFIAITLMIIITAIAIRSAIATTRGDYRDYGGDAKIAGQKDAIDFLYTDAKRQPFGLFIFSPPIYTYQWDYLLWWYGEKKYGYVPSDNRNGSYYLLMQVDHDKPWSYQGWIETVIKPDALIAKTELTSGLIIQKHTGNTN